MNSELLSAIMTIEGFTGREEIAALYEHATQARHGIVEIGSYCGRSTVALALGSKAGHNVPVYAIDPHEPFTADDGFFFDNTVRARFMQNVLRFEVADVVRLVNLPSYHFTGVGQSVDLVFVDGDHRYAVANGDLMQWSDGIAAGGHLLIHDCNRPEIKGAILNALNMNMFERLPDVGLMARFEKIAD